MPFFAVGFPDFHLGVLGLSIRVVWGFFILVFQLLGSGWFEFVRKKLEGVLPVLALRLLRNQPVSCC